MITGIYAAILALMLVFLSANVIKKRFKFKVGIGAGGNHELEKAIRVQANFTEHVPLAIILIGICELNNVHDFVVHGLGITLVIGRILHVIGLTKSSASSNARALGMVMTFTVLIVGASALLMRSALTLL